MSVYWCVYEGVDGISLRVCLCVYTVSSSCVYIFLCACVCIYNEICSCALTVCVEEGGGVDTTTNNNCM